MTEEEQHVVHGDDPDPTGVDGPPLPEFCQEVGSENIPRLDALVGAKTPAQVAAISHQRVSVALLPDLARMASERALERKQRVGEEGIRLVTRAEAEGCAQEAEFQRVRRAIITQAQVAEGAVPL